MLLPAICSFAKFYLQPLEESAVKVTFNFSSQHIVIEGDAPELVEILKLVREIAPKLPQINILTAGEKQPAQSEGTKKTLNGGHLTMREWARSLLWPMPIEERIHAAEHLDQKRIELIASIP